MMSENSPDERLRQAVTMWLPKAQAHANTRNEGYWSDNSRPFCRWSRIVDLVAAM
jgi:hypothetical protein